MEAESLRLLMPMVTEYREYTGNALFPILDYIGKPEAPKFDDPHDIISRTFGGIRVGVSRIFNEVTVSRVAKQTALNVSAKNRGTFGRQMQTVLSVSPMQSEPWIIPQVEAFVKENVSLITSVPTENLADIEQMLYRDAKRKLSPKEMKKNIIDLLDVAASRAALIARDQVGKFNGALTELRQTNLGISRYVWRTAEDERVRPDHAKLNGTVQSWDEPPITVTTGKRAGERNHPGMDIQCRCYAEPILGDVVPGLDD